MAQALCGSPDSDSPTRGAVVSSPSIQPRHSEKFKVVCPVVVIVGDIVVANGANDRHVILGTGENDVQRFSHRVG
jgi:hypothetical protein